MRFFGYFLSVQKVTRGTGAEPRKGRGPGVKPPTGCEQNRSDSGEEMFLPRPAARESEPIGALRWHSAI